MLIFPKEHSWQKWDFSENPIQWDSTKRLDLFLLFLMWLNYFTFWFFSPWILPCFHQYRHIVTTKANQHLQYFSECFDQYSTFETFFMFNQYTVNQSTASLAPSHSSMTCLLLSIQHSNLKNISNFMMDYDRGAPTNVSHIYIACVSHCTAS